MKSLQTVSFDASRCEAELSAFASLLASNSELTERRHILPFFRRNPHLSAFVGSFASSIVAVDRLAYELSLFGDFSVDLAVGDSARGIFCLVEFEHATTDGVFRQVRNKSTREWSPRFEHGFSQLIDWFFKIDDMRGSRAFQDIFGPGHVRFFGVLVAGRSQGLTDYERLRFEWRKERVLIDSKPVLCLTFDDLCQQLQERWQKYTLAYKSGGEPHKPDR